MRLPTPKALWSLTLTLALASGCSGGAPTDEVIDGAGGSGGEGAGGDGSGGDGSDTGGSDSGGAATGGDGSGGEETDGSGGDGPGTGGAGSGGDGSGGQGSGGEGGFGGSSTGGQGGSGSGGDGSGGSSGQCTNGDTQAGTTACGLNGRGTLVQSCENGFWADTAVCTDGDECEDDDEQTLFDVCGFNDRGDIPQTCVEGFWSGSDCDDPDECEDEDEQTLTDVCGFNDRGDIAQVCVDGLWDGSACDDPDECEDDDGQVLIDVCGFNDRGDIPQLCVEGAWDGTDCDDPDECEDDATDTVECLNGSGEQDLLCVEGAWETDGDCTMAGLYRASVSSDGVEGNGNSTNPSLSTDGRYVAFESTADNLVDGDDNAASDIFVHDLQTGETRKVSSGSISGQDSYYPSISGDGRYVAFTSEATDLVTGDNNGWVDVFVVDLETGTTTRATLTSAGAEVSGGGEYGRISANGRWVTFLSLSTQYVLNDTNSSYDAFLRDRTFGLTTRISISFAAAQANGYTDSVDISPDGTRIAFHSAASNLVGVGIDTNNAEDAFLKLALDNTSTSRVSVATDENQSLGGSSQRPALSEDGRYVVFQSNATNLGADGANGLYDIFLRDVTAGTTEIISVSEAGVAANGYSAYAAISGDGRYVAFQSAASTLTDDDSDALFDVFVRDRWNNTVVRFVGGAVSLGTYTNRLDLSTDGRFLAYPADASTLVENDLNGVRDVFIAPLE